MLKHFSRLRRLVVVVTAGALVAGGVAVAALSAPVLALADTSQSTEIAVEQAEINTLSTGTTRQVTAGFFHTCALLNTGAVKCWGLNFEGQLGNTTTTDSLVPVAVNAFTGGVPAVSITAGDAHTCALLNTGAVNCWGYNRSGQLGNNTSDTSSAPVAVNAFIGGATAVSITAGDAHTCALLNTGAVNCWGNNDFGRLGNGTTVTSSVPVAVNAFIGGATAVSITADGSHTCAVLNTGAVNCWGHNRSGQLGNNTTVTSSVPVAVNPFIGGATAVSITAGFFHTCALLNTGAVNCWGNNFNEQLGNNSTTDSLVPVAVDAFADGTATAASITAGPEHTCALLNTGAVNCWGNNFNGQLGNNSTDNSSVPVAVNEFIGGATAVSITAGYSHTCAVLNTGAVNCWGDNSSGQLGNNSLTGSLVPVAVNPFVAFVALAPGRLLETRVGEASTVDGLFWKMGQRSTGSVTQLVVNGRGGVASNAAAVVLNVAVTGTERGGYLTVYPCDAPRPLASNLNYSAGQTIANTVTSKVSANGKVCIYTSAPTHLIADINGYFAAGASFAALAPGRLLETRVGEASTVDGLFWKMGQRSAGSVTQLVVNGRGSVASNAAAVVLNVAVTGTERGGYLTVYPCDAPRPLASNLNYSAGQTIANTVTSKVSAAGKVCIYTSGPTHLIADINGYFAAG
jgi:hypothetical protein